MLLNDLLAPNEIEVLEADDMLQGAEARHQASVKQPKLTLPAWMASRRPNLIAGRPFDLDSHEYLRGIYADTAPQVVVTKAAQMGISEYLISWVLWSADERNATGLYVMPTDTHISDFSAARLGPAVEPAVSPYLASRIVAGGEHGADRVGLKRVGDRFVYLRGAKVGPDGRAAQLKSIDADVFVRDEVDEMDKRVKPIVDERIGASAIAEWRAASTPTYAEQGIHAEWLLSDQREWHLTCPACGLRQPLRLDNLVLEWDQIERPVRWGQDAAGHPACVCRKCGVVLDRTAPGEWVAAYPDRPVHGYMITGLASARKALGEILAGLASTDESVRMQTYNQKLGLTYRVSGAKSLSTSSLNLCKREYLMGPRPGDTYMGIDIGRLLHVVIRAKLGNGDRPLRWAEEVETFEDASRLMRQYSVRVCVVDALPETHAVRDFQKANPGRVWLAYYPEQKRGSKEVEPEQWKPDDGVVNLDRTRTLDKMFGRFIDAARGDPGNSLPINADSFPDYYNQIKAPERVLRSSSDGNQVAVYVESGPDHYAHAENYCAVASSAPTSNWDDVQGLGTVEDYQSRWQ